MILNKSSPMYTRSQLIVFGIVATLAFLSALVIGYFVLFGGPKIPVSPTPPGGPPAITLEVWGVFDDADVYEPIFNAYTKIHPNVTLRYRKFIWDDYENTLVNALASGKGPDIFMIHNTWLGKHKNKLFAGPTAFPYSFVHSAFQQNDGLFGIPLFMDNLALFYNQDLFDQEGIHNPPRTWQEFVNDVKALTHFSETGTLITSGAALGTNSKNINRATDILLLFMMQNHVEPFSDDGKQVTWQNDDKRFQAARNALEFYTNFANPAKSSYSWNSEQDYSIDAFWEGKLGMMFNYAYNIQTIKDKAPYLNFGTAPIPTKDSFDVSIGNYWGLGVSKQSANRDTAWDFLQFFSADEQYVPYIRQTKRLPAKDNLLTSDKQDPLLKAFVDQVPFTRTPYQPNEKFIQQILDDMIAKVNNGQLTLDQALRYAADNLKNALTPSPWT